MPKQRIVVEKTAGRGLTPSCMSSLGSFWSVLRQRAADIPPASAGGAQPCSPRQAGCGRAPGPRDEVNAPRQMEHVIYNGGDCRGRRWPSTTEVQERREVNGGNSFSSLFSN